LGFLSGSTNRRRAILQCVARCDQVRDDGARPARRPPAIGEALTRSAPRPTLACVDQSFASFRASICGIEELDGLTAADVTHVLSLLDPGWPDPASLDAFGARERLDLRFHDIVDPLPGLRAPALGDVEALLAFARRIGGEPGSHLLVHCQKGLSRSTASMALVLAQARPDCDAASILAEILRLRPRAWPNFRIIELGDRLLERRGSLIAAAAACYRAQIAGRPRLKDAMIEMGRTRELAVAERF
jgi:predicted protein tyrosine phosphatase